MLRTHINAYAPRPTDWPRTPSPPVRPIPTGKIAWAVAMGHWGDVLASLGLADGVRRALRLRQIGMLLLPTDPKCEALVAVQPWVREVHCFPLETREFLRLLHPASRTDSAAWLQPYAEWAAIPMEQIALTQIDFTRANTKEGKLPALRQPLLPDAAWERAGRLLAE